MRTCRMCGEEKPDSAYQVNVDPVQGRRSPSRSCRDCRAKATSRGMNGGAEGTVNPETGELRCSTCKAWKVPDAFGMAPKSRRDRWGVRVRGGRDYLCRDCKRESVRRYGREHRDELTEKNRQRRVRKGEGWHRQRVHAGRKYIPQPGDQVYVKGAEPPFKGVILRDGGVDHGRQTARIKSVFGVDEWRWTDFVSYESLF